ncbi:MAG: hypothetical protein Q8K38_08130 [Burkholderiaceae bacterium]|nr:hypothetical protein [Burkholderiaceae bacterium]
MDNRGGAQTEGAGGAGDSVIVLIVSEKETGWFVFSLPEEATLASGGIPSKGAWPDNIAGSAS